jgi:hypothetical protein
MNQLECFQQECLNPATKAWVEVRHIRRRPTVVKPSDQEVPFDVL